MLEYEWGNPTPIILSGEDPNQEADPNRQIFDHYATNATTQQQSFNEALLSHQPNAVFPPQNPFYNPNQDQTHHNAHSQPHAYLHSLYNPRSYSGGTSAYSTHLSSLLSHDHVSATAGSGRGYFLVPKTEEVSRPVEFTARIGLNLGGRTYFSSAEHDFVSRLYRRARPGDPSSTNSPRCQAEGCNADLSNAKHYHRRHKVCEFHSKASTVIAAGLTQRFCQQCSRFHILSEFDNGKRSCRKRLADHNRRRRKSQQQQQQQQQQPYIQENQAKLENGRNSSSDNHPRSPPTPDTGVPSSSSVTVALSPQRMSLDYFRQRPYNASASSSAAASTFFFSSG